MNDRESRPRRCWMHATTARRRMRMRRWRGGGCGACPTETIAAGNGRTTRTKSSSCRMLVAACAVAGATTGPALALAEVHVELARRAWPTCVGDAAPPGRHTRCLRFGSEARRRGGIQPSCKSSHAASAAVRPVTRGGAAAKFFGKSTKNAKCRRDKSLSRAQARGRGLPATSCSRGAKKTLLHRLCCDMARISQGLKRKLGGVERSAARRAVQSGGN